MSWREEKAKILYQHVLERKRILLSRLTAFCGTALIVIIAGILTNWIGQDYASAARKSELEYQSVLELDKNLQTVLTNRKIEGYQLVFEAFGEISSFCMVSTDPNNRSNFRDDYFGLLLSKMDSLRSVLDQYSLSLDERYVSFVRGGSFYFGAIWLLPEKEWVESIGLSRYIYNQAEEFARLELMPRSEKGNRMETFELFQFPAIKYDDRPSSDSEAEASFAGYVDSCLLLWKQKSEQIKDVR